MKIINLIRVIVITLILLPCLAFAQTWKVNLQQADISAFINQVSEITNKSFILDPRVKGKVTVISNTELDKKGVLRLFFAVLSVHGYAAVETPEGIKIVPESNAKQTGLTFDSDSSAVGALLVTQVIAIKNVVAAELVPILRPLIPPFGHLAAVNEANALIISDRADNIRELQKLIARLDNTSDKEIRVVPLKYAWAGDLLKLLTNLTEDKQGGNNSSGKNTSKVIADETTNRLILKGEGKALDQIEDLIKRLDQPAQRSNRLHVIPLRYADATETAELISSLLGADPKEKDSRGSSIVKADKAMNRLVISAEPSTMADLTPIIQELDIPRAQVLVEAIIVEITMDDSEEFGFQWLLGDNKTVGGTSFSTAGSNIVDLSNNLNSNTTALSSGATLGSFNNGSLNLSGVLQALEGNSHANLLSTPKIMTLDNQKSKILVGETRPFQTGGYSDTSNNAFVTTERHDIGLTLEVTPHINAGDEVKMDVTQIVEAASSEQSDLGTITTKREITTTVIAGDNQTIVLGGLMQDNMTEIHQKVPLFGDIPVVGALFRSSSMQKTKRNLLVFLRPTILRDKKHANAVTGDAYRSFKSIEMSMPDGDIRPATVDSLFD